MNFSAVWEGTGVGPHTFYALDSEICRSKKFHLTQAEECFKPSFCIFGLKICIHGDKGTRKTVPFFEVGGCALPLPHYCE